MCLVGFVMSNTNEHAGRAAVHGALLSNVLVVLAHAAPFKDVGRTVIVAQRVQTQQHYVNFRV